MTMQAVVMRRALSCVPSVSPPVRWLRVPADSKAGPCIGLSGPRPSQRPASSPTALHFARCLSTASPPLHSRKDLRNVAIIAHVDHGKTSLVDCLLKQSETGLEDLDMGSRVMDSNKLEQERGITILSKCASVVVVPDANASDGGGPEKCRINLIDTPGHADFGGEVERIMNMVDGVCLVVDATEGPMSQTKFVLMKALGQGMRPIVVINKCDRDTARVGEVENEIFDMFANLGADDEQLDFPIVYASAKMGWASLDPDSKGENMEDLFETILGHVPPPTVVSEDKADQFRMLVTQTQANQFLGKELIGRVESGSVRTGDTLHFLSPDGKTTSDSAKVLKISQWFGIQLTEIETAKSGDVIAVAGFPQGGVNDTLCASSIMEPLECVPIDPPVLSIVVTSNSASPLSGQDGDKCTFPLIIERLEAEAETNVSIQLERLGSEQVQVHGRGELQLGILLEQMRREGFELACSSPEALLKNEGGEVFEPVEELVIDCANEHAGTVIEKMAKRKAEMESYDQDESRSKFVFKIPFRSLLGYRAEFTQDTRGDGVIHSMFAGFTPHKGPIDRTEKGALVSKELGKATAHALGPLEARGTLFVSPGEMVYPGMVVGESAREGDMDINPCKEKELTNVRAAGKDDKVKLTPPKVMTIEECITYVREDELIEITPKRVSIRKMFDATERKRRARNAKNATKGGK